MNVTHVKRSLKRKFSCPTTKETIVIVDGDGKFELSAATQAWWDEAHDSCHHIAVNRPDRYELQSKWERFIKTPQALDAETSKDKIKKFLKTVDMPGKYALYELDYLPESGGECHEFLLIKTDGIIL